LLALLAAAKPALVRDQTVTPPIAPKIPENVGIVRVAVREMPRPALMVRIRNQSDLVKANLRVTTLLAAEAASPADPIMRNVDLPARDGERDYFFDVDRFQDVVFVELVVDDELKTDNRARLVRERSPAALELRSTVSPELARMIEVYSRQRPPSDRSARVAIVDSSARLASNEVGVVVTSGLDRVKTPLRVTDHPITAHVRDWNAILSDASVGRPPPDGWTPILQSGDRALVAVREQPARQVWVGLASDAFARSTDFVIFWTDVFDWLGGGSGSSGSSGSEFRAEPSTPVDGKLEKPAGDQSAAGTADLSRPLLIAALIFLSLAAMLWKPVRSTRPAVSTQDQASSVASKRLA
jgi:hypothetical protein